VTVRTSHTHREPQIWAEDGKTNSTCLRLHDAEVAELREVDRGERRRLLRLHAWRGLCVQGKVGSLAVLAALAVPKLRWPV
jgi:hypothetical protein